MSNNAATENPRCLLASTEVEMGPGRYSSFGSGWLGSKVRGRWRGHDNEGSGVRVSIYVTGDASIVPVVEFPATGDRANRKPSELYAETYTMFGGGDDRYKCVTLRTGTETHKVECTAPRIAETLAFLNSNGHVNPALALSVALKDRTDSPGKWRYVVDLFPPLPAQLDNDSASRYHVDEIESGIQGLCQTSLKALNQCLKSKAQDPAA